LAVHRAGHSHLHPAASAHLRRPRVPRGPVRHQVHGALLRKAERGMIPRLYAIVDAGLLAARAISLAELSSELVDAGVGLIQYRDKTGSPQQILEAAAQLRATFAGRECRLILNDRPDL